MTWDASKHPRKPAGTPEGGEFRLNALSSYEMRGDPADFMANPQQGWRGGSHKTGVWVHKNPLSLWYEGGLPGAPSILGTLSRNMKDARGMALREADDKVSKTALFLSVQPKFKPKK
jgi:hypothetical protein